MSRQRTTLFSVLLIYVMLPFLLCSNLRCYYSPYITNDTRKVFKLVVTECPPKQVCYKASAFYGEHDALTHHGCMLLNNCDQMKMISIKGATYNTSYSCCDWSYCNSGTGIKASFTLFVIIGSLFIFLGL